MKTKLLIALCICGSVSLLKAQEVKNNKDSFADDGGDTTVHVEKRKYDEIQFSGYVRSFFFYRDVDVYELGDQGRLTLPKNISLGDAYDEPIIHLEMRASPFSATTISTELAFDNRLLRGGSFNETVDEHGRMGSAWYMFNFQAETFTEFGSFSLTAGGGVNWYRMTPLTMWSANDFNSRVELFDRVPWEYQSNDFERYNTYYTQGDIPREQKVRNSATQGVTLEESDLPARLHAGILVG
ncbi:MAG: hypothetical protein R6U95_01895, partial [Bacteroidales bacterium]